VCSTSSTGTTSPSSPPLPTPTPPPPTAVPAATKLSIPKKTHQSPQTAFGSTDFHSELTNTVRRKQQQRQQQTVNGIFEPQNNNRSSSNMDALNEELMRRVSKTGPKRNYRVVRQSGPNVPLTFDSSPGEVTDWLNSKGFSKLTITSLGVLSGAQLFSLTKDELQQVCQNDGARVYSQLMVQKANIQVSP
ncbi:putative epidermal growth factor receptor kinase substrate 8-like protein 2-like isoform X1, partial [Apostichopus japonicus]